MADAVLTHLDETGKVHMVDIGNKQATARTAVARGRVRMGEPAFRLLEAAANAKGDVLNTARIAGIQAAKRCAELIPLCHSLPLSSVSIDFSLQPDDCLVDINATCRTVYQTGVEMEAMTACSVAALTIYDMCKAADKGIVVEQIQLQSKTGGKSGDWHND